MHTGSYINGEWCQPNSSRKVRNVNPADTSDVIAEFAMATAADTERAIDAAAAAFLEWKKTLFYKFSAMSQDMFSLAPTTCSSGKPFSTRRSAPRRG